MIIYHGGTDNVKIPEIRKTDKGKDFGIGFYTTGIKEQAEKWAKRQCRIRRVKNAVLNIYEYDNIGASSLKIKTFDEYSTEWLDFVVACRQDPDYKHEFDIVIGKIADDDVGETVQAVVDGLAPKDFALSKLIFMPANNQICFCTDKSLSFIKFLSEERLN